MVKIGYSQIAIAAYNGVHFASVYVQKDQYAKIIQNTENIYLKSKFCNKLLHVPALGLLLAAEWDTGQLHFISLEKREVVKSMTLHSSDP